MSEDQVKTSEEALARLQEELDAERVLRKAIVESALNIAKDRDGWKAYAMRMISDRACTV